MIITIDGPTASGKSSLAKALAEHCNFYYLNTGMLYRAVTYILVTYFKYTEETLKNVKSDDLICCTDFKVFQYTYDKKNGVSIVYKESDITHFLKDASIDMLVCIISPQPLVREYLSLLQHTISKKYDVIIEGRDVGSVVFPNADYKFYLTASLEIGAQRWQKDQALRANVYSLEESKEKVSFRDARDMDRKHSPLLIPENAIVIDNTELSFQETVNKVVKIIKK